MYREAHNFSYAKSLQVRRLFVLLGANLYIPAVPISAAGIYGFMLGKVGYPKANP